MPPLPASHWWYRIATNLMPSIAVLFLFLFSNTGNQLSTPWVTINTLSTVTGDGLSQNQTVLIQVESRSLNSLPIVYQCLGINGVCTRNATGIALDPLDLGISEAVNRRLCLSLLLGSLAASLCGIVAALMFQFHSCRVDGEGRPLPHVHKLCISNRQVGKVLLVALMSSALTATLSNVATRLYYESITAPFMDALPPPLHAVTTGVGYEVVVRTTNFGWGAFILLSLSYFLGPLRWRATPPPQVQPAEGDEDEVREWGGVEAPQLYFHIAPLLLSKPGDGDKWVTEGKLAITNDEIPMATYALPAPSGMSITNPLHVGTRVGGPGWRTPIPF